VIWFAILLLTGAATTGLTVLAWRRRGTRRHWLRWLIRAILPMCGLVGLLFFAGAGYAWWYTHRSHPAAGRTPLFHGITHIIETRWSPRPMVIHVVEIDTRADGVSFLATPADRAAGHALKARKTSTFVEDFGVQIAINANYFYPFKSNSVFDYYPHEGDPVDVVGYAASRGDLYSEKKWRPGTLFVSEKNLPSFEEPVGPVYNAIAGNGFVVRDGKVAAPFEEDKPYPRAGLGLDAQRRRLFFVIIDGKQWGYSDGATLTELAEVMIRHGVHDGIRLDEGGSSTIAARNADGSARVLNSTINHRIPHFERVVANHLGVFARPLPDKR
jgi:hypothetical protein